MLRSRTWAFFVGAKRFLIGVVSFFIGGGVAKKRPFLG